MFPVSKYLVAIIFGLGNFLVFSQACDAATKAKALIVDAQGQAAGEIVFEQVLEGVRLTASLHGISAGEHAFHIHENALTSTTDFQSAGGHFNPEGRQHGLKNPEGYHCGDMDNFTADQNGHATFELINTSITLEEEKPNSLFKAGGTSVILHAGPDDHMTDPAGNAGSRIAGGTILAD